MNRILYVIVLFLFMGSVLKGEVVILKNGQRYEGKIINQTREKIQVQLKDGRVITLNKENIQRIQYGPTPEELRKEEEERKRLEEQKRKRDEERRRLEEQKRIEEERRRLEELKRLEEQKYQKVKIREPLFKRNELFMYLGLGSSNTVIPLDKFERFSLITRNYVASTTYRTNNVSEIENLTGKTIATAQLKIEYKYNQWIFGLKTIDFDVAPLMQDFRYFGIYSYSVFSGFGAVSSVYSPYNSNLLTISDAEYNLTQIYAKYFFYKFTLFEEITSYLAVPFGIGSHDIKANYQNFESIINSFLNHYVSTSITSNDTSALFTGISLENYVKNWFRWDINLFLFYGNFAYLNNKLVNEDFSPVTRIITQFDLGYFGIQSGYEFTNHFERVIYQNFSFFVNLSYYEIDSKIKKLKFDGFIIDGSSGFRDLSLLSSLMDQILNGVDNKTKNLKEINRILSMGISYKIDL